MVQETCNVVDLNSTVKARPDVFATSVDDELVLFDPEKGAYYGAGVVGERIWALVSEGKSIEVLCEELTHLFDVDRSTCEADVIMFLNELEAHGLVSVL